MKRFLMLCLCCLGAGCATLPAPDGLTSAGTEGAPVPRALSSWEAVNRMMPGLGRTEAQAMAGPALTVGYESKEDAATHKRRVQPMTVQNPYRSETLTKDGKTVVVDYYLTHTVRPDGIISDNELTPVVFENNRLTGKGWEFWNRTRQAYQTK